MELLGKLLVVAFVGLLITLLMRPDSHHTDDLTPVHVLRYGWRFRLFILLFCGPLLVVPVLSYLEGGVRGVGDWISIALLYLLALYSFIEVFFVKITFDEYGVVARSPWRKKQEVAWSEFTKYDFSGWNQWHLLKTENKGTLRFSIYLTGLDSFFEELVRRRPDVSLSLRSET